MSQKEDILDRAEAYVFNHLQENLPEYCLFHNYQLTSEIVNVCKDTIKDEEVSSAQGDAIQLAAWFQFTGYTQRDEDPTTVSIRIAKDFLTDQEYAEDCKELVLHLIQQSSETNIPESKSHQILLDATHSHYGRKRYFRLKEMLRLEYEYISAETYSDVEWEEQSLSQLINHRFYTAYARKSFGDRKIKNISKQQELLREAKEGKKYGRGIETLYRANYRNHINLSAIADGKANMMISLNTIILSVIITLSGAGFTISENYIKQNLQFVLPVVILLIGATSSVVFAILSARPKVTSQEVEENTLDIHNRSFLYFGNFLGLGKKGFQKYINQLKQNQDTLYNSMTTDIYNLGVVLDRKYKLLHYSYNSFMIGLIASVVCLLIIFLTNTMG